MGKVLPNYSHEVILRLIQQGKSLEKIRVAVCHPCSDTSLLGTVEAAQEGLIDPVLVGPSAKLHAIAARLGLDLSPYRIVETSHSHDSAVQAVSLCRNGECDALMKGSLHTDEIMHEALSREGGLRTERRCSHVYLMEVPTYPRLLLITDAAININPGLSEKRDIVQNAVDLAHVLDIPCPKVALLSAVETVNPKIQSTLDAAALCKMSDRGQITGAMLDGPLAFDNAVNLEAARIKEIDSPVAGQADILVVPDLESGNMLAKQLQYLANARAAGVVLGMRVPIILSSRADSADMHRASCAVAVKYAHAQRQRALLGGAGL